MREKYPSTSDYRNPKLSQFATRLDPETSKCPNRSVFKIFLLGLANAELHPRRLSTKESGLCRRRNRSLRCVLALLGQKSSIRARAGGTWEAASRARAAGPISAYEVE